MSSNQHRKAVLEMDCKKVEKIFTPELRLLCYYFGCFVDFDGTPPEKRRRVVRLARRGKLW